MVEYPYTCGQLSKTQLCTPYPANQEDIKKKTSYQLNYWIKKEKKKKKKDSLQVLLSLYASIK